MKRQLFFCFIFIGFFAFSFSAEAKVYLPDGAGFYSSWNNTSNVNPGVFGEVDEYPTHNSDTDYNQNSTTDAKHSYNLENETGTGTIPGATVKVTATAKLTLGTPSLTLFLRLGASETSASAGALSSTYVTFSAGLERPGGGSWSISDINSLEAGFQMTGSGTARVTQLYIDVAYKTETNRVKFHILQNTGSFAPGGGVNEPFSFTITDPIDEIKNAFIEIKGVGKPGGSLKIKVSIDDSTFVTSRAKTYTIYSSDPGRPVSYRILYDVTDYFKEKVRASGGYSFTLNVQNDTTSTVDMSITSAKLIITYTWIVPPTIVGAYGASGYVVSSTFDTQAVNGASFNSLFWRGVLNGGKVQIRIATSNLTTGPWNDTDFYGESSGVCAASYWYEPQPDASAEINACKNQFNNKKYFRYKVRLCSSDCTVGGSNTPQVNDVIVNYSP